MYLTHCHKKGGLMEEGGERDSNRSSDLRYRRESGEKCPIPPETRLFSSNVVVDVVVVRRNSEFNVSRREQHAPREDGNASQHGLHFTL